MPNDYRKYSSLKNMGEEASRVPLKRGPIKG